MKPKTANLIIMAAAISLLALGYFIDIDEAGLKIFGAKWHLRFLDAGYQQNHRLYKIVKSFNFTARGRLKKAFSLSLSVPAVFALAVLQIPWRAYLLLKKNRKIPKKYRIFHLYACIIVLTVIFIDLAVRLK